MSGCDSLDVCISEEYVGRRFDSAITDALGRDVGLSRSKVSALISEGKVLVDGATLCSSSVKVFCPCQVTVLVDSCRDASRSKPEPENISIAVVYEDDYIAVINKQPGLVCHPAPGNYSGTLVNALMYHFGEGGATEGCRYGIVHRLDKDTSGLMLVAKTDNAHAEFSKMFHPFEKKSVIRRYICFCHGTPDPRAGVIDNFIGRHPTNRQTYYVCNENEKKNVSDPAASITNSFMDKVRSKRYHRHRCDPDNTDCCINDCVSGKRAITNYVTVSSYYYTPTKSISMVECELKTGRTHQIRVHMKHVGNHILGDPVYGQRTNKLMPPCVIALSRQALHSAYMEFVHPFTGELMSFDADIPDDLREICNLF